MNQIRVEKLISRNVFILSISFILGNDKTCAKRTRMAASHFDDNYRFITYRSDFQSLLNHYLWQAKIWLLTNRFLCLCICFKICRFRREFSQREQVNVSQTPNRSLIQNIWIFKRKMPNKILFLHLYHCSCGCMWEVYDNVPNGPSKCPSCDTVVEQHRRVVSFTSPYHLKYQIPIEWAIILTFIIMHIQKIALPDLSTQEQQHDARG